VERLIVHPDRQGKGIGTRLMSAIEAALAPVRRYELFTGHRSERNLSLYRHLGYSIVRREPVHARLEFVYLQKPSV
jgi:GNAT superfamily N-acetyltransferase